MYKLKKSEGKGVPRYAIQSPDDDCFVALYDAAGPARFGLGE